MAIVSGGISGELCPKSNYCRCDFNAAKEIDLNSCEYKPRKNEARAKRVEWEHILRRHYNML